MKLRSAGLAVLLLAQVAGFAIVGQALVPPSAGAVTSGDLYTPQSPKRILDSRPAFKEGPYGTPWGEGTKRDVQVAGTGGVPSDADAVVLNVTVTNTTKISYLTIWPAGDEQPVASSLNWSPTWTIPNSVTVKVGAGGKVSVYNNRGNVDVIFDVVGYYKADSGAGFTSLSPARVLDSRPPPYQVGPYSTRWGPTETRDVQVAGVGGVPTDAEAVLMNVTVTETHASSYLTIWPKGQEQPLASSLNWGNNYTIPNSVTVKVGAGGYVSMYNNWGHAYVIVDVVGYYKTGSGSAFHPSSPARIQDSRPAFQHGPYSTPWGVGTKRAITVTGVGGVPVDAQAVLMNMTVTDTTDTSYLTIWPTGDGSETPPVVSSLNWVPLWTIPNSVTSLVGTDGKVSIYNNRGTVNVIADVAGWYG